MLAPNVWPRNTVRGDDGVVSIAGVHGHRPRRRVRHARVRHRRGRLPRRAASEIADAFGGGEHVHYAAKAFLCTEVARWVDEEGLSLDVCSGGELAVALHAGFPPERIALHGNNKSVAELTAAVKAGVGHVVLDSMTEIDRLDAIAGAAGRRAGRAGPGHRRRRGAHPRVHRHRARGPEVRLLAGQRRAPMAAVRRVFATDQPAPGRAAQPHRLADLRRRGLRGRRAPGDRPAARRRRRVRRRQDRADRRRVDLGGGLGISYLPHDDPPPVARAGRQARARSSATSPRPSACPRPRLVVEPGRAIAGPGHRHAVRGRHRQGRRAQPDGAPRATSASTAA